MSGVLFVVHIPSKEIEQKIRDNKKIATVRRMKKLMAMSEKPALLVKIQLL